MALRGEGTMQYRNCGKKTANSVTRGFRSKSARKKIKIRKLLNKGPQKSAIFADLLNKNFKKFPQETFKLRRFCGKPQSLVTLTAKGGSNIFFGFPSTSSSLLARQGRKKLFPSKKRGGEEKTRDSAKGGEMPEEIFKGIHWNRRILPR